MFKQFKPLRVLTVAIACQTLGACGSAESGGSDGNDDGPFEQPPPGGTVVPAGLDLSFIPGRDMELLALTLQEGPYGPEILVAMRNPGTEYICGADFHAVFGTTAEDDAGELGIASLSVMGLFMYETPSLMNCIAPGEVGFGATDDGVTLYGELREITRVYYQFRGFLYPTVTPVTGLSLEGITSGPADASGTMVSGSLKNDWTAAIFAPEVLIFSINDVGRPLTWGLAVEDVEVLAGSSWGFEIFVPGPLYNATPRFHLL
jgi:hypothetical protein